MKTSKAEKFTVLRIKRSHFAVKFLAKVCWGMFLPRFCTSRCNKRKALSRNVCPEYYLPTIYVFLHCRKQEAPPPSPPRPRIVSSFPTLTPNSSSRHEGSISSERNVTLAKIQVQSLALMRMVRSPQNRSSSSRGAIDLSPEEQSVSATGLHKCRRKVVPKLERLLFFRGLRGTGNSYSLPAVGKRPWRHVSRDETNGPTDRPTDRK